MTSIISFRIDNGDQMIIVGDTQHTYLGSTFEETKLFPLKDNKLIFCGAGKDKIIQNFYSKIISKEILEECKDELLSLKLGRMRGEWSLIDVDRQITMDDVFRAEFLVINSSELTGKKICEDIDVPLNNIDIIGSGGEIIGQIQPDLQALYHKKFESETKEEFFRIILKSFAKLGRIDAFTGHPAIFQLEVYVLDKAHSPKKFTLKFRENVEDLSKYEVTQNA